MSAENRQKLFNRGYTVADMDDAGHYFVVLEYDSLEAAAEAGALPDSVKLMQETLPYVTGDLKFTNCDVLSSEVKPPAP